MLSARSKGEEKNYIISQWTTEERQNWNRQQEIPSSSSAPPAATGSLERVAAATVIDLESICSSVGKRGSHWFPGTRRGI